MAMPRGVKTHKVVRPQYRSPKSLNEKWCKSCEMTTRWSPAEKIPSNCEWCGQILPTDTSTCSEADFQPKDVHGRPKYTGKRWTKGQN